MLQISGCAGGTTLTGTLYEEGEHAPSFRGAPEEDAAFVWVCDEFYAVASGGAVQQFGEEDVRVAFESPMPRGFDDREQAIDAAREHVRTQFARAGISEEDVEVSVEQVEEAGAEV